MVAVGASHAVRSDSDEVVESVALGVEGVPSTRPYTGSCGTGPRSTTPRRSNE